MQVVIIIRIGIIENQKKHGLRGDSGAGTVETKVPAEGKLLLVFCFVVDIGSFARERTGNECN